MRLVVCFEMCTIYECDLCAVNNSLHQVRHSRFGALRLRRRGQEEAGATAPRRPQKHAQSSRLPCGKRTPGPARACTPMRHWLNRIIFALARNHRRRTQKGFDCFDLRYGAEQSGSLLEAIVVLSAILCVSCVLAGATSGSNHGTCRRPRRGERAFFGPLVARDCCEYL
jgi:hypothetical protein